MIQKNGMVSHFSRANFSLKIKTPYMFMLDKWLSLNEWSQSQFDRRIMIQV